MERSLLIAVLRVRTSANLACFVLGVIALIIGSIQPASFGEMPGACATRSFTEAGPGADSQLLPRLDSADDRREDDGSPLSAPALYFLPLEAESEVADQDWAPESPDAILVIAWTQPSLGKQHAFDPVHSNDRSSGLRDVSFARGPPRA